MRGWRQSGSGVRPHGCTRRAEQVARKQTRPLQERAYLTHGEGRRRRGRARTLITHHLVNLDLRSMLRTQLSTMAGSGHDCWRVGGCVLVSQSVRAAMMVALFVRRGRMDNGRQALGPALHARERFHGTRLAPCGCDVLALARQLSDFVCARATFACAVMLSGGRQLADELAEAAMASPSGR